MELSSTKIVLNKEPADQQAPAVKERHESEKVIWGNRNVLIDDEKDG